jgi:hypothetical protein
MRPVGRELKARTYATLTSLESSRPPNSPTFVTVPTVRWVPNNSRTYAIFFNFFDSVTVLTVRWVPINSQGYAILFFFFAWDAGLSNWVFGRDPLGVVMVDPFQIYISILDVAVVQFDPVYTIIFTSPWSRTPAKGRGTKQFSLITFLVPPNEVRMVHNNLYIYYERSEVVYICFKNTTVPEWIQFWNISPTENYLIPPIPYWK